MQKKKDSFDPIESFDKNTVLELLNKVLQNQQAILELLKKKESFIGEEKVVEQEEIFFFDSITEKIICGSNELPASIKKNITYQELVAKVKDKIYLPVKDKAELIQCLKTLQKDFYADRKN